MRVRESILVDRPPKEVWTLVGAPDRYREFFTGVTKWEPRSDVRDGIGARYRVLSKVGAIEAGGTLRVTEWEEERAIAWESESGIRQTWRVEVSPEGDGTRVSLEIAYGLSGGAVGWLVERITGRIIARHIWATLMAARRMLEHEN